MVKSKYKKSFGDFLISPKLVYLFKIRNYCQQVYSSQEKYNCGLREAKDYVDNIAVKHNVISSGGSGSGCSVLVLIGIGITLGAMFLL